jgi:hypothetical protein
LDIPAHMRAIEKVFSWEINETDVATFNDSLSSAPSGMSDDT